MANESAQLVIDPAEEIHFKGPYTQVSKGQLRATNTSTEQHIALKVLTTDPKRYVVHPNYAVVPPGTCTVITVEVQPLSDEAAIKRFISSKQKFMVQWRALPGTPDLSQSAHVLYTRATTAVTAAKFTCQFDDTDEPPPKSTGSEVPEPSAYKSTTTEEEKNKTVAPANASPMASISQPYQATVTTNTEGTTNWFRILIIVIAVFGLLSGLLFAYYTQNQHHFRRYAF